MNEKTKLANFFDNIVILLSIVFLNFLWSGYVVNGFINQISLSLVFGCSEYYLLKKLYKHFKEPSNLKKSEKNTALKIASTLLNADPYKLNKFFLMALSKKFNTEQIAYNHYKTTMDNDSNAIFIISFSSEIFTKDQLLSEYMNYYHYEKIFILSSAYSKDCISCSKKMQKVILLDCFKVYSLLKFLKIFPKYQPDTHSKKISTLFAAALKRENAKSYFKIAIILLIGSIFVTKNWFYRIMSSFGMLLTILCIIQKRSPTTEESLLFFET